MRKLAPGVVRRARVLRRELTPPELKLWLELKHGAPGRCPFRKQHPLGQYVLDFYCAPLRLAVEVDGWVHNMGDAPARDERRDAWLRSQGVEVMRIPASDVLADPRGVADGLLRLVWERLGTPR